MAAATTVRPEPGGIVLRTERLTKRFGELVAVSELDLEVRAGEVHGFLGPNGSGKSTTVGMVLELIEPTSGRIERFGELAQSVGAIVETPAFYPYLSGRDNLRALALAAGGDGVKQIDALLEEVGLAARASSPYRTYSLGMKQRLGSAATLLTDPALVILDEPTNGLDPAGQQEIRELIPRLAHEGRACWPASTPTTCCGKWGTHRRADRRPAQSRRRLVRGTAAGVVGWGSIRERQPAPHLNRPAELAQLHRVVRGKPTGASK